MYRFFVFFLFLSVFIFTSDGPFADTSGDKKTGAQPAVLSLLLSDAAAQSPGIKVYDADGQFLGVSSLYNYTSVVVFIPSLEAFITLEDIGKPEVTLPNFICVLTYEDYDCTGQGYTGEYYRRLCSNREGKDTLYFVAGPYSDHDLVRKSYRGKSGECINNDPPTTSPRVPKALMIDKSALPFDPDLIVGPIRFKMN